mmetsp:Transcript_6454/g.9177  ORF Transcript_6454/g.9177 Transcript_6454/m.9177 type:complete len:231 (+) Transcript_6454:92-784(+)
MHGAGKRVLPPKMRLAAEKNELRARKVLSRMTEERRLAKAEERPGYRQSRAQRLRSTRPGHERRRLFRQVYRHLDYSAGAEAVHSLKYVFFGLLVLFGARQGVQVLLDISFAVASPTLRGLSELSSMGCSLTVRFLPYLIALWVVASSVRLAWNYRYYSQQRTRLRSQPQVCAVCLDSVGSGHDDECASAKIRTLRCGHRFHEDCIDPWLAERGRCPLCLVPSKRALLSR